MSYVTFYPVSGLQPHNSKVYNRTNMAEGESVSSNSDGLVKFNRIRLVGIEYPGYIEDENRMLETLGGEEALSRTYSHPTRRLELSFRPGDPYSHTACGDRCLTANLLLRVKQRKKKRKEGGTEPHTQEVKYEQEILGVVGTTFKYVHKVAVNFIV